MQKNKNHFEVGEKRVVWKEAAKNVAKMAAQIENDLEANKIDLNEVDKEKVAEYKTKKEKVIFWSKKEREKFAKSLTKEDDTKKSAEEIMKLIHAEISNELFENKMDEAAKDYEEDDSTDDGEEIDKNKTRDIIEDAFEEKVRDLNPMQREELENLIKQKLRFAFLSDETFSERHFDSKVTKEEAGEIAEFIKNWKPEEKKTVSSDEPQAANEKIATATEELGIPIKIADWANKKATEENLKLVENHGEKSIQKLNAQIDDLASKYGFDSKTTKEAFKNLIALNIGWFSDENNKETIEKKFTEFDKQFQNSPQDADEFFKLRGITNWKNNPELLLKYFTFNGVEKDLDSYRKFVEGKEEKLQQGETIEIVEANAKVEEIETTENNPNHSDKSVANFAEATKLLDEGKRLWNEGKKIEAVKSFLFAFVSMFKGALYFVSSQGGSLLSDIPKELGGIPIIGHIIPKVKGFISNAGNAIENFENPQTIQAITRFFGVDASNENAGDEIKKIKSNLKKITIGDLLGVKVVEEGKNDPMEEFKTKNNLTLTATQLRQLQKKLKDKNEGDPNIKDMRVFDFLKKRIDKEDNSNYLA